MNEIIQRDRFVAFLDIMGFKERVARTSAAKLYNELSEFYNDISNIIFPNLDEMSDTDEDGNSSFKGQGKISLILAQFSDSIAIFTEDDSLKSLKLLSEALQKIFFSAITRSNPIPLKGALSKGYMTCDMTKQLFFGQALIDAYLLEEDVQFYGLVVHHTAENDIKTLNLDVFRDTSVPLKSGKINHYELSWYKYDKQQSISGLNNIRLTVSASPRRYVDNTKGLIDEIE